MNNMLDFQKLTQKQEMFSQAIFDGLNQTDAYKAAGYSFENMETDTVSQVASRLASDSKVLARIRELQDQIAAGKAWSFQSRMDEVKTNIAKAREVNQMVAAIRGTEQALKLSGLLTERPQDQSVQITKVTVVLRQGNRETAAETRQFAPLPQKVIDGEFRTMPEDEFGGRGLRSFLTGALPTGSPQPQQGANIKKRRSRGYDWDKDSTHQTYENR